MVNYRHKAVSGAKWLSASMVISQLFMLVQMAVVARVVGPKEFGLVSILVIVFNFAKAFADMGMGKAVIHFQDIQNREISALFVVGILFNLLLAAGVWFFAPVVARFFASVNPVPLLRCSVLVLILIPFGNPFVFLLEKSLRFRFLAILEVLSALCGNGVAIVLVLAGFGVYSVVWGMAVSMAMRSGWLLAVSIREKLLDFSKGLAAIGKFVRFGAYQIGERVLNTVNSNLDYIFVGGFIGQETLGLYTLSYELSVAPYLRFNPLIARVVFPVLAIKQNDDAVLRKGLIQLYSYISFFIYPVMIWLAGMSSELLPLVLGTEWETAVPLVRILCLYASIRSMCNPIGILCLAKGRPDIGFKLNVFVLVSQSTVFFFSVHFGILVFAWSFTLLMLLIFILIVGIARRLIQIRFVEIIKAIIPSIISAFTMAGVLLLSRGILLQAGFSDVTVLIISSIASFLSYIFAQIIFNRNFTVRVIKDVFFKQTTAS